MCLHERPIGWNDWYMTRQMLLMVAAMTFSTTACGAGDAAPAPTTTVATSTTVPETTTTVAPDPYSLDDLADAHTTLAKVETTIFIDNGYGGDLVASAFTCDALERAASFDFVLCAMGGTVEHPFALVIGDEYVSREQDTATTSLLYQIFQPVPHDNGVRAQRVLGGYKTQELVSFDSLQLTVGSVTAGVAGTAISLHYRLFGPSRTWNVSEMIGLNSYGSADVVATFSGEGVADFADDRGFIFTNYHYADNEGLCCPSYYAINYFRPGPSGWTRSVQTVPNDPDRELTEEPPFRDFASPAALIKYEFARAKSNDE